MSVSPLARRVATAAVLVPVVVYGVLGLPSAYFGLLMALFVLAGAWEWADLSGYPVPARLGYVLVLALLLTAAAGVASRPAGTRLILSAGALFWIAAFVWVARYQSGRATPLLEGRAALSVMGVLVLVPPWAGLYALHRGETAGPELVLLLMLLVWSADVGAFFAGRRFGRRKLAPRVSPGKTVEGVLGGVALAAAVITVYASFRMQTLGWAAGLMVLGLATVLVSVLGDLLESLIKRRAGRKDSGVMIPGHGGALDRIDSLTAAAPVFALGLALMGIPL
jgi:phosphatidate cytidylyltransferase